MLTPTKLTRGGDSLTGHSGLDSLTEHSVPAPATSCDPSDSLTIDSGLDSLTVHSVPRIAGLDWERDGWRVSLNGEPATTLKKDQMLTTTMFDAVDVVVVEQAHMRERDVYSVAQVYTLNQLRGLPFRDKVRLFPGMPGQLARAARAVGNVTEEVNNYGDFMPDKEKDAETMAGYAAMHPDKVRSWKPYLLPDEDPARRLWGARDSLRYDLKEGLNPLRVAWNNKGMAERYALPEVVDFCALLDANFDRIPEAVLFQFGISQKKLLTKAGEPTKASCIANGIRVERMSAAITAYLCVYTREGELRTRPDGEFIGIRFILDSLGMSNSYRPNMARSQLTHHGMRHYKGGRDGGCRSEYMRNLRHFLAFLRDASTSGGDSFTRDSGLDSLTLHSVPASKSYERITV